MNTRDDLSRLLEEWLRLTRAEETAIRSAAWSGLREIQAQKAELQKSIAARGSHLRRANSGKVVESFRAKAARLISLETRNAALLAAQLGRARSQQESLAHAERNLNKIQSSYARPRSRAAWQSYS
jgi:hypothetical protein